MNLEELSDKLPDRDTLRREFGHFVDGLPSRDDVRARVSDLPTTARNWLPGRHEPVWTDTLTTGNLVVLGIGIAIGAGLAALLSPRSGPALRRDLIARVQHLRKAGPHGDGAPPTKPTREDANGTGVRADLSH